SLPTPTMAVMAAAPSIPVRGSCATREKVMDRPFPRPGHREPRSGARRARGPGPTSSRLHPGADGGLAGSDRREAGGRGVAVEPGRAEGRGVEGPGVEQGLDRRGVVEVELADEEGFEAAPL